VLQLLVVLEEMVRHSLHMPHRYFQRCQHHGKILLDLLVFMVAVAVADLKTLHQQEEHHLMDSKEPHQLVDLVVVVKETVDLEMDQVVNLIPAVAAVAAQEGMDLMVPVTLVDLVL
tara:strand:- start:312 stop:659 length:348 start_codon:yes stop_codon:yes gene_type:complete